MSFTKVRKMPHKYMAPGVLMSFETKDEIHTILCYKENTFLRMFPYVESRKWKDTSLGFTENLFSYMPMEYML